MLDAMARRAVAGVFVGGASRRMGGSPKGLLRLPSGETLVDRWLAMFAACGVDAVLVGVHPEYAPRTMIPDAVLGVGPLGGLVALLRHCGSAWAVAVGCDMPCVSLELVRRLLDAPDAVAVAPRREGRWEPMLARYDAERALVTAAARLARGEHGMQGLLDELGASPLALTDVERAQLDDWDSPEDVAPQPPKSCVQ
jgi:molybdopterin-guanine dinucleotide biosynthesis protein A